VVSFTPWLLYPQGKSPWYPMDWRLGGPKASEEKNSRLLLRLELLIIQSVAQCYTTKLSSFIQQLKSTVKCQASTEMTHQLKDDSYSGVNFVYIVYQTNSLVTITILSTSFLKDRFYHSLVPFFRNDF
jgi:hypothetical protein